MIALAGLVLLAAGVLRAEQGPASTIDMTAVSGTAAAARSEVIIPWLPWKSLEGAVRYRRIRNYQFAEGGATVRAVSSNLLDIEVSRPLSPAVELAVTVENLTNRSFHETMNYAELRVAAGPGQPRVIRGFTADPITISAGITFHLGRK